MKVGKSALVQIGPALRGRFETNHGAAAEREIVQVRIEPKAGVPVWCGGRLESGVERVCNMHLASLQNFPLSGDVSESAICWHEDVIEPPFVPDDSGHIQVPTGTGTGIHGREDAIQRFTVAHERLL